MRSRHFATVCDCEFSHCSNGGPVVGGDMAINCVVWLSNLPASDVSDDVTI